MNFNAKNVKKRRDREFFFIRENQLAEVLSITLEELDEIIEELLAPINGYGVQLGLFGEDTRIDFSRIEVQEWVHFMYLNKTRNIRLYSQEGALAIADYLSQKKRIGELDIKAILNFIEKGSNSFRVDQTIRQAVYENSSSLTKRRERHWISYRDVTRIFKTTSARLNVAFQNVKRSDNTMKIEEDFEDIDLVRYYSFSGLEKLSIELATSLHSPQRRKYCERVPLVAPPVFEELALPPASPSDKDIERAMRYAKGRDKDKCQVTESQWRKTDPIDLVKHHLFDQKNYRLIAADPDNIITISKAVSDEFHQWNGGYDKTCTIDDFIKYVEFFYSDKHRLILHLYNRKKVLDYKLKILQSRLPESDV
jgi:hypothetical protein